MEALYQGDRVTLVLDSSITDFAGNALDGEMFTALREAGRQLAVEPYGGVLLHTWLDRDLSLAGRVTVEGSAGPETHLVDFARPLLRVPNLAIHLYREIRQEGLKLNEQQHMVPVMGLDEAPALAELVATELGHEPPAAARFCCARYPGFSR